MTRVALSIVFLSAAAAQEIHERIDWEKLAPKAVESVDVNLDGNMLQMAARFLSSEKPDEARAKKLLGGIQAIHVKSLKFEKEGEYSMADVDAIRAQLKAPQWSKVVDVRSRKGGDNAGVFFKTDGKEITGLVVIAAEPKELTMVNIIGTIDPENIRDLSGRFGIPRIDLGPNPAAPKK